MLVYVLVRIHMLMTTFDLYLGRLIILCHP